MKYSLFFISAFIFAIGCTPKTSLQIDQQNYYKGKYASFLKAGEEEVFSHYQYMVALTSEGKYIKRVFYPEKMKLTQEYEVSSTAIKSKKTGNYQTWFDDGSKYEEGQYSANLRNGYWKTYIPEKNTLDNEGAYSKGKPNGEWKYYHKKGTLHKTLNWSNGYKEGKSIIYDTLGNISNEIIYKSDTILSQTNENAATLEHPYFESCENMADAIKRSQCTRDKIPQFIYSKLEYPALARENDVEGKALIQFVVDKEGDIKDIRVLSGVCESIEKECLRVITKHMPKWKPGKVDTKNIQVSYKLPIKFKLT